MERGVSSPSTARPFTSSVSSWKCSSSDAVEFGAVGQRDDLARLARVEVAQVVELADVFLALAVDGGVRRWRAACWWSCPWPRRPRRDGGRRAPCTMPATRSMAAADSTEVPPNFMTIISRASLPSASARHSARPRRPRRESCCGPARRTCSRAPGTARRRPTKAAMPRSRSASLRGCGRLASFHIDAPGAAARSADCAPAARRGSSRSALRRSASRRLRRELHRDGHGVAIDHRHAIAVRADLGGQRLDVVAGEIAQDLLRLLLHLLFFAADERNHVADDVHGRHAGIARAGDGLHAWSRSPW